MPQPQHLIEAEGEDLSGNTSCVAIMNMSVHLRETRLGELDVPVAERILEEFAEFLQGCGELIRTDGLVIGTNRLRQSREYPAVLWK